METPCPPKSYKTQAFRRYTSFSTKVTVTAEPGYYAAAYRFVNQSTGQETQLIPLPTIQVQ